MPVLFSIKCSKLVKPRIIIAIKRPIAISANISNFFRFFTRIGKHLIKIAIPTAPNIIYAMIGFIFFKNN